MTVEAFNDTLKEWRSSSSPEWPQICGDVTEVFGTSLKGIDIGIKDVTRLLKNAVAPLHISSRVLFSDKEYAAAHAGWKMSHLYPLRGRLQETKN